MGKKNNNYRKDFLPGCTGKVPFFSEGEARIPLKRSNMKNNQVVYHCKYLFEGQEHWHISSMSRKVFKEKKHEKKMKLKNKQGDKSIKESSPIENFYSLLLDL